MPIMKYLRFNQSGFTLVEMAMVLLIIALLLGGLVPVLSGQIEQRRITETKKQMDEIKEALAGYAIIYGYLPCPTTTTDPSNSNYGVADTTCTSAPTAEGYLPWKTLGVPEMDAWGNFRADASDSWIGHWRYRVDRNFSSSSTPFTLSTSFADSLVIQDSSGNTLTTTTERPVAVVYSTGPNVTADGANTTFDSTYQSNVPNPSFDDIMIWISRPQLFNRMVTAGKLP